MLQKQAIPASTFIGLKKLSSLDFLNDFSLVGGTTFFNDAEPQEMPATLLDKNLKWPAVKKEIEKKNKSLYRLMANTFFQFKQFTIHQDRCAMKVTTDACLFGAWATERVGSRVPIAIGAGARKILDIGTGTGLLALMLGQQTNALIDTIEIDKDAFEQAKENIDASPWRERINVYHADIRKFSFPHKYDVIISNPPFYENELKSPDEKKNIAHHTGLPFSDLLDVIFYNLDISGEFYLLLPSKRLIETGLLLSKHELPITESMMIKQSTQHDYFRVFIKGVHTGNQEGTYSKSEMAIWNEKKEYTKEFVDLLKDYYLYF